MGGRVVTPIIRTLEEGAGTKLKQSLGGWLESGSQFLKSLGPEGEMLERRLADFEHLKGMYGSNFRTTVEGVFKDVDPAKHSEIEELWGGLRSPNQATDPVHIQKAQNLSNFERAITQAANNLISINPQSSLVMSPKGPNFYSENLKKPNSPERNAAIFELQTNFPALSRTEVIAKLDATLNFQRSNNSYEVIYNNPGQISTGRASTDLRWTKWAEEIGEKLARVESFGAQDEYLSAVIETIKETKGLISANNASDFLNVFFKQTSPGNWRTQVPVGMNSKGKTIFEEQAGINKHSNYKPMEEYEQLAKKVSSYAFTSLIAIPQLGQVINLPFNAGYKNTLKGIYQTIGKDYNSIRDFVVYSGTLDEYLRLDTEIALKGGDTWIEKILRQPGFRPILQGQTVIAGHVGRLAAQEAASKLIAGSTRPMWRQRLFQLGLDADAIKLRGHITEEEIARAAYQEANRTLFMRSSLNTPYKWEESAFSRLATQYKQFIFVQTKVMKDGLQNAYKMGAGDSFNNFLKHTPKQQTMGMVEIAKFVAYVSMVFPVVGGLYKMVEDAVKFRKESDPAFDTGNDFLNWYVDSLAHAGGFGISYSMLRSVKQRKLTEFMIGPIPSTVFEFGEDALNLAMGKVGTEEIAKDITRRLPVVGPAISNTLIPGGGSSNGRGRGRSRSRGR